MTFFVIPSSSPLTVEEILHLILLAQPFFAKPTKETLIEKSQALRTNFVFPSPFVQFLQQ